MSCFSKKYFVLIVIGVSVLVAGSSIILTFPTVSLAQTSDASTVKKNNYAANPDLPSSSNNSSLSSSSGIKAGELQIRYTGLIRSDISPEVATALGLNDTNPGILVTEVIPNSPAEKAGIKEQIQ